MSTEHFESLDGFAHALERFAVRHVAAIEAAAGMSGLVMQEKIKKVIGDNAKLQDLAPATQEERVREGFTANDPLKRSGELLESYEHMHEGMIGGAGSSNPLAFIHEFGTATIPERPAVEIGLRESEKEIMEIAETAVGASLGLDSGHAVVTSLPGLTGLVP